MPGIGPLADPERAKPDCYITPPGSFTTWRATHEQGPMIDQVVIEPLVEAALKEPPNDHESKLLLANDDARRHG